MSRADSAPGIVSRADSAPEIVSRADSAPGIVSRADSAPEIVSSSFLEHLCALIVSGADAESFLHGQCTADVKALGDQAALAALCASNGRVLALGWLARVSPPETTNFVWYLAKPQAELAHAILLKFKLRAKVTLTLSAAPVYPNQTGDACARLPNGRGLSLGSSAEADLSADQFRTQDIADKVPWNGAEERFVPQMLELERFAGLSLKKGCFPGQEVISRLHYKGELKRRIRHVCLSAMQALDLQHAYAVSAGRDRVEILQQQGLEVLLVAAIALPEQFQLDEYPTLQLTTVG